MSSVQEHRDKAEHNEFLCDELDNPFWDWAVTATFYAAVHYVEAYLAHGASPKHSKDHTQRDSTIQNDAVLKTVYDDYRFLKLDSIDARYRPHIPFGQGDVERAKKYLETVKAVIVPLI